MPQRIIVLGIIWLIAIETYAKDLLHPLSKTNHFAKAISPDWVVNVEPSRYSFSEQGITLIAGGKTDLYRPLNPEEAGVTNASMLLFKPGNAFILSARIEIEPHSGFDGAALVLYNTEKQWVKLLLEQFHTGELGISSTVVQKSPDDVYHRVIKNPYCYLKIVKTDIFFVLYMSDDGRAWHMLRNFTLPDMDKYRVGFLAQSPIGEGTKVKFSNIVYQEKLMTDFWSGT